MLQLARARQQDVGGGGLMGMDFESYKTKNKPLHVSLKLKADQPHPCYYPYMPPDYRHTRLWVKQFSR